MLNKIKAFFKKPAVTSNPSKDNYIHVDDYDEDSFSNELKEEFEEYLMNAYKDMESGTKYMEFGNRKIGFGWEWDETGEKGTLELFDLKYPAAPGKDVVEDQFPERASVVLNFSGVEGLQVLIDTLSELKSEMINAKYDYIENELVDSE